MLFMLLRDCSASGMFAVHNVMSCPALVRKLVFGFYNSIVQAICASDIWWKSSIRANWNKLLYVCNVLKCPSSLRRKVAPHFLISPSACLFNCKWNDVTFHPGTSRTAIAESCQLCEIGW